MRSFAAFALALSLAGCNMESKTSNTTTTNSDGSTTKTEIEERTTNGVQTGSKTETLTEPGGKVTVTKYAKKDGQWVKE